MGFCLYETCSRTKKEGRPWTPLAVYVDGVDDLEFHFSRSRSKRFPKNGSYARKQSEWVRKSFPRSKSKKISCAEFHLFAFSMETVCLRACWFKSRLLGSPLATRFASGHQVRLWPPVTGSSSHGRGKFARRDDATVEPSAAWTDTGQCYSCDHQEQKLEG